MRDQALDGILQDMSQILQLIDLRGRQELGERVRLRRQELGLNQTELASVAGISQGYLSAVEHGRRRPSPARLRDLSAALGLPEAVLIGAGAAHDNPQPLETRDLPLYGSIPAGPPSQTQESVDAWPVLRHLWSPDHYCLRLSFDSMEPTLKPGDVVLVRYSPEVHPLHVQGKICACLVGGQPTLKRVNVEKRGGVDTVVLRGDNPEVAPIVIGEEHDFSIQGMVIRLVSRDL